MKKKEWGLVVDSSSGYSKKYIESKGHFYVPFFIYIDEIEYIDGVNLDREMLVQSIDSKKKFRTSTQNVDYIKKIYEKSLKKYENIIVISLSSKLSSMHSQFVLASKELSQNNNIYIPNSNLISVWSKPLIDRLILGDLKNNSFKDNKKYIDEYNKSNLCTFYLNDITLLSSGGRITQTQATLLKISKITPTLIFNDGEISKDHAFKTRNSSRSLKKSVDLINDYFENNKSINKEKYYISVVSTAKDDDVNSIKEYIINNVKNIEYRDYKYISSESVILAHVGYDVTGIAIIMK